MPNVINADNGAVSGISGLTTTADNSGVLQFQSSGTATLEISTAGNINIPGTGKRITGDFSNATHANRVLFRTSTTNGNTSIGAVPNGTAVNSNFVAFGAEDPTNAPFVQMVFNGTEGQFRVDRLGTGTFYPLTFYTGGSERLRIDTSGNVGIGISAPGTKLQVVNTGSTDTRISVGNANAGFQMGVEASGPCLLANFVAQPIYFATNGTERMRLDSLGNVLVGLTSVPGSWGVIPKIAVKQSSSSGGAGLLIFSSSNENAVYAGYDSTASVGRIGVSYASTGSYTPLIFETGGSETLRLSATSKALILAGGNASANGTGIAFPGTLNASSDPNTLDDYEEGTYTPVLKQTVVGSTLTYNTQYVLVSAASSTTTDTLTYVKIGRVVYLAGSIRFLAGGAGISGRFNLSLPFARSGSDYGVAGSVGLYNFNQTLNQGTFLGNGGNSVDFFDLGPGTGTHVNLTTNNSSEIYFNFFYLTST
jgi:hypothetical protein